jgi:hypothetical protein
MLYAASYRPPTRTERRERLAVALVFATMLIVLTAGATLVHFAMNPSDHRVDFPPADWSTTPPNWVD